METYNLNKIFYQLFDQLPTIYVRAPGRVNLIGEHVDYNDGPVLPMAINQEVTILAGPTSTNVSNLFALDLDQTTSFRLNDLSQKIDTNNNALPDWAEYPAGVAWALQEEGYQPNGINVLYSSNIPIGSGLSSSAAVEVGFATLWNEINQWQIDQFRLAKISQKAENQYIGVSCGLMDQFASACGVIGSLDSRSISASSSVISASSIFRNGRDSGKVHISAITWYASSNSDIVNLLMGIDCIV